jgi:hypothetical protein
LVVAKPTIIGHFVAAPELRETVSGKHVTTVPVATHSKSHDVVLWGQVADFACSDLGRVSVSSTSSGDSRAVSSTRLCRRDHHPNRLQVFSKSAEVDPAA